METLSVKQEELIQVVGEGCGSSSVSSVTRSSSSSASHPQPMEGLHEMGPPPFLTKTYEMVENPETDPIVSWSSSRNSFVVWDNHKFSSDLLPKYFKHSNFSSFIRQLNTYGFRKIDSDKWEFANEWFLGGQKHLLKNIKRKRHMSRNVQNGGVDTSLELGQHGYESEIDKLKRERNVLMVELVKLREKQKSSEEQMVSIEKRLEGNEKKQQLTMSFIARAFMNPGFVQHLFHMSEKKELGVGGSGKKRRLPTSTSSDSFQEEIISAAMNSPNEFTEKVVTTESDMETLISSPSSYRPSSPVEDKMDSNPADKSSDITEILGSEYDKLWEYLNEDMACGNKEKEFGEGNESETDIHVEDFVLRQTDWSEDTKNMVQQMEYLTARR